MCGSLLTFFCGVEQDYGCSTDSMYGWMGWMCRAGQYGYINIPAIDPFEWHPFTISSAPSSTDTTWTHHIRVSIR